MKPSGYPWMPGLREHIAEARVEMLEAVAASTSDLADR